MTQELSEERAKELEEQIREVALYRSIAKSSSDILQMDRVAWEEANKGQIDEVAATKQDVIGSEAKLRDLTLQAYDLTGNKAPAVGVGIREVTTYSYDNVEALAWAKEHGLCLKLDDTAFKKQVKVSPLSFVTATTESQATIATDLEIKA